jgi:hypothetical protein
MKDPKRLIEDSDLASDLREALEAERCETAGRRDVKALRSSIFAAAAVAPITGLASAGAGGKGLSGVIGLKTLAAAAIALGAGIGAHAALSPHPGPTLRAEQAAPHLEVSPHPVPKSEVAPAEPAAPAVPSTTDPKSCPGYGTDRSRGARAEQSDAIKKDALGGGRRVPARTGTELSDRRTSEHLTSPERPRARPRRISARSDRPEPEGSIAAQLRIFERAKDAIRMKQYEAAIGELECYLRDQPDGALRIEAEMLLEKARAERDDRDDGDQP